MTIVRYFFVGGAAAAVDIALFILLAQYAGLPWFPVAIFSFVLATMVNYVLSIKFVFDSGVQFGKKQEIILVFFTSGIGLCVNQAFLWVLIEVYETHLLAAKIFATGSVFFWNYSARRLFIFRSPK